MPVGFIYTAHTDSISKINPINSMLVIENNQVYAIIIEFGSMCQAVLDHYYYKASNERKKGRYTGNFCQKLT